jgi:hypothetical protein
MLFAFGNNGAFLECGSSDGLGAFSLAQTGDILPDMKKLDAGASKYMKAALHLVFGIRGHPKFKVDRTMLPEPFKSDPDVTYYLDVSEKA